MATAIAGLVAEGETEISDAEYCKVSFPNFFELMKSLGAKIDLVP
jgi:3-phosphoshikimate 1-carboxyvinyltransferase